MMTFEALALKCAPAVALDLLAAIVAVESGFDPLAANIAGKRDHFHSVGHAVAGAVGAGDQGLAVGVGLAGLPLSELGRMGIAVGEAFDACRNLGGAQVVILAAFAVADRRGVGPASADRIVIRSLWRDGGRFVSSIEYERAVQVERTRLSEHSKAIVRGPLTAAVADRATGGTWGIANSESASLATKPAPAAVAATPTARKPSPAAKWEVFRSNPSASASPTVLVYSKPNSGDVK